MASKSKNTDKFVNRARAGVTQTAANTLTFAQLQSNVSLFDKVAMVIHKVDWWISSTNLGELGADLESLDMLLTTSNQISTVTLTNPAIICRKSLVDLVESAVGFQLLEQPLQSDFSNLPGGGLIVPANPIYIGLASSGLATAGVAEALIYFTWLQMTPDEYWELVESTRIIV